MTLTVAPETAQSAIALLEKAQARMIQVGWMNSAATGDNGELCLANTLWEIGFKTVSLPGRPSQEHARPVRHAADHLTLNLCRIILGNIITRDHHCPCARQLIRDEGGLLHFNDRHCTGAGQAVEIYAAAIKEIQEITG